MPAQTPHQFASVHVEWSTKHGKCAWCDMPAAYAVTNGREGSWSPACSTCAAWQVAQHAAPAEYLFDDGDAPGFTPTLWAATPKDHGPTPTRLSNLNGWDATSTVGSGTITYPTNGDRCHDCGQAALYTDGFPTEAPRSLCPACAAYSAASNGYPLTVLVKGL